MAYEAPSYTAVTISQLAPRNQDRNIPDDTIGALTYNILDVILFAHIERDLPRTCWVWLTVGHGNGSMIVWGLGIDRGEEVRLYRGNGFNYP
jgi:hypothetical protein